MRRESRDPVRFLSKSCFGARKVTHVARMGTRYVKGCYQMRSLRLYNGAFCAGLEILQIFMSVIFPQQTVIQ